MTKFEKVLRALFVLSVLLLLLSYASPNTHWIVHRCIFNSFFAANSVDRFFETSPNPENYKARLAQLNRISNLYPTDKQYNIAVATLRCLLNSQSNGTGITDYSYAEEVILKNNPGGPEYAHLLRLKLSHSISLKRETKDTLTVSKGSVGKDTDKPNAKVATDPAELAKFDEFCQQGETLEPNNGVFPLMRAIGLYESGRDEEAIAALHRASTASGWNEHFDVEIQGRQKMYEALYGHLDAITSTASVYSILYPQYAGYRGVSRFAVQQAIQKERSGDLQGGLVIRQDIQRVAAKFRLYSQTTIGSLVANAIFNMAMSRPGGEPPPAPLKGQTNPGRVNYGPKYVKYLQSIHRDDEAKWVNLENNAQNATRVITTSYFNTPLGSMAVYVRLATYWAISTLLIIVLLWHLIFALASATYLRLRGTDRKKRAFRSDRIIDSAAMVLFIGFVALLANKQLSQVPGYISQLNTTGTTPSLDAAKIVVGCIIFGPIVLLLVISAIYALIVHKRVGETMAKACRAFGLIYSFGLSCAALFFVGKVAIQDNTLMNHTKEISKNELAAMAKVIGKPVPGPVPDPNPPK